MSILAPISPALFPIPLLRDFPLENGWKSVFRKALSPSPKGDLPYEAARVIPPNLPAEDYSRIAGWAELPDRLAYYEFVDPQAPRTFSVAVMVVPGYRFAAPVTPMWMALSSELNEFVPRWRSSSFDDLPAQVLLHDRPSNLAYLVPVSDVDAYLGPCIHWHVPTDPCAPLPLE